MAPPQDGRVVLDLDATLLTARSDKQNPIRTRKKTFGFRQGLGVILRKERPYPHPRLQEPWPV
ncbi:MAG: hypothetical protein ACRDTF_06020 [Pseudonocardiaceae bacterium]